MKKNNPAVSVIIPMYNTEKYIGECLTSLAAQTFQDFEIVVVDDCSTDNSRAIAMSFSAHFGNRLNLMKLPRNSGCSGVPKNFALKAARGKYVYFLDSDDLLTATALEELYTVAENFQADVVHAEKAFTFNDADGIISAALESNQTDEFVTEPTLETFDTGERVTAFTRKRFLWWACNKLFRRQLLIDNKITFPATKSFEDFVFTFASLVSAKNYVRVPFVSYYYRIRKNSLSHEVIDGLQFMKNLLGAVKGANDFMSGRKFFVDNPQYKYLFTDSFVQERLEIFSQNFLTDNYGIGEVYDFLCQKVFSQKPQDNVALTSYLFLATNIFKLYTTQQAAEIAELKRQLAALKNNLEVSS